LRSASVPIVRARTHQKEFLKNGILFDFWPFVLAYVVVGQLAFSVSVIQPLSDANYKLMKIYNKDFTLIIDIHFYETFSTPNSNP
jgi:hypothetical protein